MAQKYYRPFINVETITDDQTIEPKGAACLEFIRVGDDDVTVADGMVLTDTFQDWAWINPPHMKISQRIPVKFAGASGTTKELIVIKYFYQEITKEEYERNE